MSELSPQARTVLNALLEAKFGKEAVELGFPVMAVILGRELAASLRAAADQLTPYTVSEMAGAAFARNKLLAIADELEAQ